MNNLLIMPYRRFISMIYLPFVASGDILVIYDFLTRDGAAEGLFPRRAGEGGGGAVANLTSGGGLWDNLCFFLRAGGFASVAEAVVNDLQAPCVGLFPGVARTLEALRAAGCRGVTLCGSGATVFGLVGSREEGERALAHPALAGCWRACAQTLPDGVMAAHGPLTPIVMVRIHVGQPCSV